VVSDKAAIMKGVGTIAPSVENKNIYSAEDITVHDFGDAAVLAFRLVARTEHKDGKVETANYRNTAMFLRRNGKWQVVAWQATKIADASAAK
jgi:ketosteroid isomerase-like protein